MEQLVLYTMVDLRTYDKGDEVHVQLKTGDVFTGTLISKEQDMTSDYSKGWLRFTFEGDWWNRIKDEVDSEQLFIHQEFTMSTGDPKKAVLRGVEWIGEEEEMSEPVYKTLGTIEQVEKKPSISSLNYVQQLYFLGSVLTLRSPERFLCLSLQSVDICRD